MSEFENAFQQFPECDWKSRKKKREKLRSSLVFVEGSRNYLFAEQWSEKQAKVGCGGADGAPEFNLVVELGRSCFYELLLVSWLHYAGVHQGTCARRGAFCRIQSHPVASSRIAQSQTVPTGSRSPPPDANRTFFQAPATSFLVC